MIVWKTAENKQGNSRTYSTYLNKKCFRGEKMEKKRKEGDTLFLKKNKTNFFETEEGRSVNICENV